jgi:hypothetical protein
VGVLPGQLREAAVDYYIIVVQNQEILPITVGRFKKTTRTLNRELEVAIGETRGACNRAGISIG